jgi:ribosomal protein L13
MTKNIRDIQDILVVLKRRTAKEMLDKRPEMVLELGVKGMLPKTKLGKAHD